MRAFVRRVVNAIAREPEDARRERERSKEAAKQKRQPVVCDLCTLEGHIGDNCWTIIKSRADVERTWSGARRFAVETDASYADNRELWERTQEEQ